MMTLDQKIDRILNILEQINSKTELPELMNVSDVAQFLHRKPSTIRSWIAAKQVPYYKRNGTIYFLRSDLISWIKKGRIKTELEQLSESILR